MTTIQIENAVFGFSEIVKIAGLTKSLAQNWTSGRPLRVWPSVVAAGGTGGRNLFNIYDGYLLALLSQVRKLGAASPDLINIHDLLSLRTTSLPKPLEEAFARGKSWLGFSLTERVAQTIPITEKEPGVVSVDFPMHVHGLIGRILIVDLNKLRQDVDRKALRIIAKRKQQNTESGDIQ